jgi:thioredoxin 1
MSQDKSYVTFTDENFQREVLESNEPVLVDFWAAWCGPCRVLGPVVEELAAEYQGKVKIGKLNVDENPASAQQFGIRSIPTILFFENGKVVDQSVGAVPKGALAERLNSLVKTAAA